MGYPTTLATKTEWAIQQSQLPKQCGLSSNVGYQTEWAIQQRQLPNSVDYPTTSATKTEWAIQQRRLPNQCELYKPRDIGYQSSAATHGVCAIHAVLVNQEGGLSKSAVIGTEGVWAIHAVLVIQGHGRAIQEELADREYGSYM